MSPKFVELLLESKNRSLLKARWYVLAGLLIPNLRFIDILLRRQITALPSLSATFLIEFKLIEFILIINLN